MIQKPKFQRRNMKEKVFWESIDMIVNRYFKKRKKVGGVWIKIKAFILLLFISTLYLSIVNYGEAMGFSVIFLYFFLGIFLTSYSMNVMHEGSHRTFSSNKWLNKLAASSNIFIVGGNPKNWDVEHNMLHHPFTNIVGVDDDISSGNAVLRFTKYIEMKFLHRFQKYPVYIFMIYSLLTLNWFFATDIVQTKRYLAYQKTGLIRGYYTNKYTAGSLVILYKLIALTIWIAIPILVGIPVKITIVSFFFMHLVMGTILAHIFQPAHINEYALEFKNSSDLSTKMHQLRTSIDYGIKNRFLTEFSGGLNYQKAHHIFPNITHQHYGVLTRIIKIKYAEFYKDNPYPEFESLMKAIAGNYSYLKENSISTKELLTT